MIILLFVLAALAYWRRMKSTGDGLLLCYVAACVISGFAELVLSGYIRVFDTYNILGHLYKVAAFLLIYSGIFIAAVKEPYKRLVEAQAKLNEEILERRRIENELRAHRDHLEEAVRLRTAELAARESALSERTAQLESSNKELESFSYSISHDLRAPLRAIDGYSRMIMKRDGETLSDETKRQFQVIRESIRKMGNLIDDLLAFSRMGRQELSRGDLSMDALVREVWEELVAVNPDRAMTLKMEPMPASQGDRALIRQVYGNLLGNAVKFTQSRDAAVIEAGSYVEDRETVYYVRDNGVGFDMKFYHKLFGVFQRLHTDAEYEGTGIGLALVKRIIDRHGGRVWAEGKAGEGTTFYFTLLARQE